MRIAIIGDSKPGAGGNKSWAANFASVMKTFGIRCDYIGDANFDKEDKLFPISVNSSINSFTLYNNLKTPAEVLQKIAFCQRRLYEQLRKKIYDAYIIQRFDFLPVIQSLGLSEKVPIYIPNHDIAVFEQIISPNGQTTEAPYRIVPLIENILNSKNINILSSSRHLGNLFKGYNNNLNVSYLPIALHAKIESEAQAPIPSFKDTEGVLWVGSKTAYKNPDMMFEIVKKMPHINFTMIFNTSHKGTFTKIEKKYKAPNLKVLDSQPLDKLIELYKSHRIGIITSNVETFCIVAQEHLVFHPTLILAKTTNEYHKIFNDNLIPFDNISEAIQKITNIYNDEMFFKEKTEETKAFILKNYSQNNVLEYFKSFIQELKEEFNKKNKFLNLNTMGSLLQTRIGVLDEFAYEDLLEDIKYEDNCLAQLGILSQLSQFKRKEYKDKTTFTKFA